MSNREKMPLVVVFGRSNVGKSTLFNRLIEEERAMTADQIGTTRDYNIGQVEWGGKKFELIDTGGIINLEEFTADEKIRIALDKETIDRKVQIQAREILSRADLILFLVDLKAGILPQDRQLALFLKENCDDKKIILVTNKTDSPKERFRLPEFYKLGLGEPFPISAATGSGTGDLLDAILNELKKHWPKKSLKKKKAAPAEPDSKAVSGEMEQPEQKLINVSIIGKPNVGKSSLINSILGQERVIVSPMPHTTREPQDTEFNFNGQEIILIDTAGISKKAGRSKRSHVPARRAKNVDLEKEGIDRSLRSLNRADIALLVLDISKEITHQDLKIADEIIGRKKSLIIIANKWDLIPEKDTKKFTEFIHDHLPFATWAPIIFVSALTGRRTGDILKLITEIKREREKNLTEKDLDKFLKRIVKIHRPARSRASERYPFIKKIKQVDCDPPEIEVMIGAREGLNASYLRFIENQLREQFKFIGTPVSVRVIKGRHIHGQSGNLLN